MNSATDIPMISADSSQPRAKKRSRLDLPLVVGIVLIAIFLGLFIIEFSRILSMAGEVKHMPPKPLLNESSAAWRQSSSFRGL